MGQGQSGRGKRAGATGHVPSGIGLGHQESSTGVGMGHSKKYGACAPGHRAGAIGDGPSGGGIGNRPVGRRQWAGASGHGLSGHWA